VEKMYPEDIKLDSIDSLFEYEKHSRLIDTLDFEELKVFSKLYCKLYLKQQEVIKNIGLI
jgi:hypothetical protein